MAAPPGPMPLPTRRRRGACGGGNPRGPIGDFVPRAALHQGDGLASGDGDLPRLRSGFHVAAVVAGADEAAGGSVGTPGHTPVTVIAGGECHRFAAGGIDQIDVPAAVVQPPEIVEAVPGTADPAPPGLAVLLGDLGFGPF